MRLADVLGSLSLATDLAIGAPIETAARTCLVATRAGRALGLSEPVLRDVFFSAILRHVGCTAVAHETAARTGGDDHDVIQTFEAVDTTRPAEVIGTALRLGKKRGALGRVRAIAGALASPGTGALLKAAQCAQAEALAGDLGLPTGVTTALAQMYERHDGRGEPNGLRGDAIALPARLVAAAQLVEALHRRHGKVATIVELRRRRGRDLDPEIADLLAGDADVWTLFERPAFEALLDAEPGAHVVLEPDRLDDVALAFARFADLKSPHAIGHSPAVAALAADAARLAGGTQAEIDQVRRAALLHDLGSVAIPNGVWDHHGPLGAAAWEQVRLHAYHTERVLARSQALAPFAAIAGAHHERADGSGYHRGTRGDAIARGARWLAVADVYVALRTARPYRAALGAAAAAQALERDARAGTLDRDAVAAILAAAGHARVKPALPSGLTEREAEVLGQVARGLSTKEIAAVLGIRPRTVKHHIEHIYEKTGVSNRAGAALFAARHDLVADRPSDP